MARKTKEDTLKTVTAILDAAETVFVTHGIANATIAQIADAAGVSKGAIYGHFKNKIEVCVAVCERGLQGAYHIIRNVKGETPLETLHRWGIESVRLFLDSSSYRNVGEILWVKCEQSPEFQQIQDFRRAWEHSGFKATKHLLRKAIAAGELPATTDIETANIYLHSVLDGLICALYYTKRIPPNDIDATCDKILRMGINTLRHPGE